MDVTRHFVQRTRYPRRVTIHACRTGSRANTPWAFRETSGVLLTPGLFLKWERSGVRRILSHRSNYSGGFHPEGPVGSLLPEYYILNKHDMPDDIARIETHITSFIGSDVGKPPIQAPITSIPQLTLHRQNIISLVLPHPRAVSRCHITSTLAHRFCSRRRQIRRTASRYLQHKVEIVFSCPSRNTS